MSDAEDKNDLVDNDEVAEATIISEEPSETDEESIPEEDGSSGDEDLQEEDDGGDGDGPEDELSPEAGRTGGLAGIAGSLRRYKSAIGGLFVGVLLGVAVGGLSVMCEDTGVVGPEGPSIQTYLASIDGETTGVLYFERFFVLLVEEDKQAYLLLGMAVRPSNEQVRQEVNEKRIACRGVIYEVLKKAVRDGRVLTGSKKKLRQNIAEALNAVLVTGTVEEVSLDEFLVV